MALRFFADMPRQGIQPDAITYNALISAFEKGRDPTMALGIFADMQRQGIKPGIIT